MTDLEQAVYPRGKIAGPFPALSSRPDEAYVDFGGTTALTTYVRNVKLSLFNQARRVILEVGRE